MVRQQLLEESVRSGAKAGGLSLLRMVAHRFTSWNRDGGLPQEGSRTTTFPGDDLTGVQTPSRRRPPLNGGHLNSPERASGLRPIGTYIKAEPADLDEISARSRGLFQ